MKLHVLSSSSRGNCYVLENGASALILEAGVPFLEVKKCLNFNTSIIDGVLVTHSHKDHSKYIKQYVDAGIPVVSHNGVIGATHTIKPKSWSVLQTWSIMALEVEHDVLCYSYIMKHNEMGLLAFITDTASFGYNITGINHLMIEANYDTEILDERAMNGGIHIKVRNRVVESHMSLAKCKETISYLDLSRCNNIILLHLSSGNSDAVKFRNEIQSQTGCPVKIAEKGLVVSVDREVF